ncbi:hypothetical protein [Hymenobacter sp. 5516J-16]|nr:hypothetical protein [Hymenobacter sp. 5516J-16]
MKALLLSGLLAAAGFSCNFTSPPTSAMTPKPPPRLPAPCTTSP